MGKQSKNFSDTELEVELTDSVNEAQAANIRKVMDNLKNTDAQTLEADLEAGIEGRLKKFDGVLPAPMQVHHGQADAIDAARLLRVELLKERQKANNVPDNDWTTKISYVECRECGGPGIWIEGDPLQMLREDNWFSSYKPKGAFWGPERQPHCQFCVTSTGTRRALRVDFISRGIPGFQTPVDLVANPRFVRTIPRERYNRLVAAAKATREPIPH